MKIQTGAWEVQRHSGRLNTAYRLLYRGDSEEKAREVYAKRAEALRQGSVELFHEGVSKGRTVAYRNRTRW